LDTGILTAGSQQQKQGNYAKKADFHKRAKIVKNKNQDSRTKNQDDLSLFLIFPWFLILGS
jgi:hypothetical protein